MVNWDVRIICRRAVALASLWSEVKRTGNKDEGLLKRKLVHVVTGRGERSDDELVEEIVQVMIHHAKDP